MYGNSKKKKDDDDYGSSHEPGKNPKADAIQNLKDAATQLIADRMGPKGKKPVVSKVEVEAQVPVSKEDRKKKLREMLS